MGEVDGGVSQCDARFYFGGVSRGLVYIDPLFLFFLNIFALLLLNL